VSEPAGEGARRDGLASGGASSPSRGASDPRWLERAAAVIRDLGFSIVSGVDPREPAATDLIVALRDEPTLRHFDPEEIAFWVAREGRGRPRELSRETPMPLEARFVWGRISIADRLGLSNQWLSFGGVVRAAELDDATTVVAFSSPAPIQRWSGHSQGLDMLTPEMGAFFGRLMIPIDFEPGAEHIILDADPLALYCAFVRDVHARIHVSSRLVRADPALATYVEHEARRLEETEGAAWADGERLMAAVDLGTPGGAAS
jgi:hypothetical protein